jgi:hypothetical protein
MKLVELSKLFKIIFELFKSLKLIPVMMFSLELVLVGWVIIIGRTKRQLQITNLLKVNSKPIFLKINILQVGISQNVLIDPQISKEKQVFYFFQCLLESLCPFKKQFEFLSFQFYIHVYVYFHTNVNMCYFI